MGVEEMMNFLGRVNSHLFGLRVVKCIQYKVSGFTTFLGSTMPGLSSVVDMGINLRTGFCQKLLAHTASHMTGAVGKVDNLAQGVTKYFVNHVAMTRRTTETDLVRGVGTRNLDQDLMGYSNSKDDSKNVKHGDVEENNNEDAFKKMNLRSPLSNLNPMLLAAKKTAANYKSVTAQMVSNISQSIPTAVSGKPKERTSSIEDEALSSNIDVQVEDHRKNALIENFTVCLLFMAAILYVTTYSWIIQFVQILQKTYERMSVGMNAMLDWIYQRRLGFFITILAVFNTILLADCL